MTTVFKSDQAATSKVDNFVGYKGPTDWHTYADFSNAIYKNSAGANIALTDVITSPTQKAFERLSDKLGNVSVSPAAIPRRSFIPAHGVFGIMSETANQGLYAGDLGTITITNAAASVYTLYATKGAAIIDKTLVNILSGSGTLLDPYIFKYKTQTTIAVGKDRADAMIVCTYCVGNRVPLNIVKNHDVVSDADINVNIDGLNRTQFTIVMRTVSPRFGDGILPSASGYVPIVKFYQDGINSVSYVKNRNVSLNIRAVKNGVNNEATQAAPVTSTIDTYAISFNNGVITHYMNGAKINAPVVIQNVAFNLYAITVLSADTQWSVAKDSDALVNLILYNRALSAAELANCLFT